MPDEQSLRVMYEARREARQQQAVLRPQRWRRRLIVGGAVLLTAAAVSVGAYVWWIGTHVRAVRAAVSAALVSLAPPLDMRVRELLVRPGDQVAKGQALVRFDDSEARAALDAAEAEGTIAQSRLAQAQATALHVDSHIHFLGRRRDVPELLASSDLFVLPSLWEGLSMALLEAMATGLPIVASEVSGTVQVMIPGETGYLVPSGDVQGLFKAVEQLLSDPARAQAMGAAARRRVEATFSAQKQADEHLALYRRLLENASI